MYSDYRSIHLYIYNPSTVKVLNKETHAVVLSCHVSEYNSVERPTVCVSHRLTFLCLWILRLIKCPWRTTPTGTHHLCTTVDEYTVHLPYLIIIPKYVLYIRTASDPGYTVLRLADLSMTLAARILVS